MTKNPLLQLARNQHGLLLREQILGELTRRQLDGKLSEGWIQRVHPRVYRVAGAPTTEEQRALALCMTAGPGAVASVETAAGLVNLGVPPLEDTRPDITVPGRRRVRIRGVRVHNTEVWGPDHVSTCRGVPVTSTARTLSDLSARLPEWMLGKYVDRALVTKLTTLQRLQVVFEDLATRGRHTSTRMRAVLEARGVEFDNAESEPEARVVQVLRKAGLPKPAQQVPVTIGQTTYRLDVAYPVECIDIEYDSWEFHRVRSAFDGDRTRANRLQANGWAVLRFTSAHSDGHIARTVRQTLSNVRHSRTA